MLEVRESTAFEQTVFRKDIPVQIRVAAYKHITKPMIEFALHSLLSFVVLVLFILALRSYRIDKRARFKYVLLAFSVLLARQAYTLASILTNGGHGLSVVTDALDIAMVLFFFLTVKS